MMRRTHVYLVERSRAVVLKQMRRSKRWTSITYYTWTMQSRRARERTNGMWCWRWTTRSDRRRRNGRLARRAGTRPSYVRWTYRDQVVVVVLVLRSFSRPLLDFLFLGLIYITQGDSKSTNRLNHNLCLSSTLTARDDNININTDSEQQKREMAARLPRLCFPFRC